jgi:hypothetical protein
MSEGYNRAVTRPIVDLTPSSYIDALPIFDANWMTDAQIDLARKIQDSGEYYFLGRCFPIPQDGDVLSVINNSVPSGVTNVGSVLGPFQNLAGSINVPSYSYVVTIGCFSQVPDGQTNMGFQLSISDKGAKQDIFDKRYVRDVAFNSNRTTYSDMTGDTPNLQYWNMLPFVVLPPGILQLQVTNLNAFCCMIQVYMTFAVPMNSMSMNKVEQKSVIVKSTDYSISHKD